jgi:hypothetical protein
LDARTMGKRQAAPLILEGEAEGMFIDSHIWAWTNPR